MVSAIINERESLTKEKNAFYLQVQKLESELVDVNHQLEASEALLATFKQKTAEFESQLNINALLLKKLTNEKAAGESEGESRYYQLYLFY